MPVNPIRYRFLGFHSGTSSQAPEFIIRTLILFLANLIPKKLDVNILAQNGTGEALMHPFLFRDAANETGIHSDEPQGPGATGDPVQRAFERRMKLQLAARLLWVWRRRLQSIGTRTSPRTGGGVGASAVRSANQPADRGRSDDALRHAGTVALSWRLTPCFSRITLRDIRIRVLIMNSSA